MTKQSQTRDSVFELDRATRHRQCDSVRAAAQHRPRSLAADRSRRARRIGSRGVPRPPPRQRHVRQRAEDRARAHADLVQRRHAPPRHAAREQDALARDHDGGRLPRPAACTSRPSEQIIVARRLRLADGETMAIETLHVPASLVPGLGPKDLEERSFYDLLENRYGVTIAGGIQTIEPTVTNEDESAGARRPAALARVPLRANVAHRGRRRSSSSCARSTAATATGW